MKMKIILLLLIILSISIYSEPVSETKIIENPWTGENQKNGFEFKDETYKEITYYYYGYEKDWETKTGFDKDVAVWMKQIEDKYLVEYSTTKDGGISVVSPKALLPISSFTSQILDTSLLKNGLNSNSNFNNRISGKKTNNKNSSSLLTNQAKNENSRKNSEEDSNSNKNYINSSIEVDFFNFKDINGVDYNINTSYVRSLNDSWETGGQLILNRRSFDSSNTFNMNFDIFSNKVIKETDNSLISLGTKLNYTVMDEELNDENAIGTGFYLKGIKDYNKHTLSYGTLLQNVFTGDSINGYVVLGGMYAGPILKTVNYKIDIVGVANVYSTKESPEEKYYMDLGANLGYAPTETFILNLGVKTKLLIEDYSSVSINLGTEFGF